MELLWPLHAILALVDQGGPVLWLIFITCTTLWLLILERLWFMRMTWPPRARLAARDWNARTDRSSWRARKIREATVSEARLALFALLPLIRVLVALCPLFGLLGTVLGMIGVFEVIAISGSDDAQAMARGVYRATIPTMSGLVVALTGVYFIVRLGRIAEREAGRFNESLALQAARQESAQ